MRTYKDKEELKNEIHQSFEKYLSEFDTVPESLKDKRVPGVDLSLIHISEPTRPY